MANMNEKRQPTEQELEDSLKKVRAQKYENTKEIPVIKPVSELLDEQVKLKRLRSDSLGDVYKELERRINRRLGSQFNRVGSSQNNPKIINK